MRPGISSYAYTWAIGVPGYKVKNPMNVFQLVEKAVELDVNCVQIADNLPMDKLSSREQQQLKAKADKSGIVIEVGTRGLLIDNIKKYLDIAARFESPILRVVIDAAGFEPGRPGIVQILQTIEPECKTRKIRLAIENHDRFKAREFLQMLEPVDTEWIGICLDSVNSMGAGEGVEVVTETLGPFTYNFHVKEFIVRRMDHKMGFQIEGRPVGEGMLPLVWMLSKINKKCTSAILEQWVPPEKNTDSTIVKEDQWARKSIQNLKKILSSAQEGTIHEK
ncbi:sugar phosphate isomerase/epimerase [candidate division KSB1 bacterium]|nr:sugar phosphate isomerase/epimerase [candidate division KSB1 bacterium]